jgi:hypothetical protein
MVGRVISLLFAQAHDSPSAPAHPTEVADQVSTAPIDVRLMDTSDLAQMDRSLLAPAEYAALIEIGSRPTLPALLPETVNRETVRALIVLGLVWKKGEVLNLTTSGEKILHEILANPPRCRR